LSYAKIKALRLVRIDHVTISSNQSWPFGYLWTDTDPCLFQPGNT